MEATLTRAQMIENLRAVKQQILSGELVPANYNEHPNEATTNAVKAVYTKAVDIIQSNGSQRWDLANNCLVIAFDNPSSYTDVLVFNLEQWAQDQGYSTKVTQCCAEGAHCICVTAN